MDKKQSWIQRGDAVALAHLQGNFDVCEIYTRKLRRQIAFAKSHAEANELFETLSYQQEKEQLRFDNANKYEDGGITDVWKDSLKIRLAELARFESPVVVLPITK